MILNATDNEIVLNFRKKFATIKDEPIVLYGLGEKTKLLIDNLSDFNFVALMDKNSVGLNVFNLPVILPSQVLDYSNNIIIVCVYASKDIIYRRIQDLELSGVNIFYMNGENLHTDVQYAPQEVKSYEDLTKNIDNSDVISFDIFDTLLFRKVLKPSDIFELIEEKGIKDFTQKRIQAEKLAQKEYGEFYNLDNIYEFIEEKVSKDYECNFEYDLCVPNKKMIMAFEYAQNSNKKVLITSDMYLPSNLIKKMLKKIGIKDDFELYLSNEFKKSKYNGSIYKFYKKKYSKKKILHIGDDEFSDNIQAKKFGLKTFYVPPKFELLNNQVKNLDDKLFLANFSAVSTNSFSTKLNCHSTYDFGLFVAPMVLNYMNWLYKISIKQNVDKILFISRDGYILQKIYELYPEPKPKSVYFYTSRRALGVCSIKSELDIIDVFNVYYMKRKITVEKFVNSAFGINIHDKFSKKLINEIEKDELLNYVLSIKDEILENAKKEFKEYSKYINTICNKNEKLAIINFVSSGTTQFFAEKIFKQDLKVFCFQTTSDIRKININFDNLYALYGEFISPFLSTSNLVRHYHTLEAVLTSPEEQFVKIKNDTKVFLSEKNGNFENIKAAQEAIYDFAISLYETDLKWFKRVCNTELADNILGLVFDKKIIDVSDNVKSSFSITDGFSQNKEVKGLW